MVTNKGRSTFSAANEYGIHENTIIKWRKQYMPSLEDAFMQRKTHGMVIVETKGRTEKAKQSMFKY